MFKLLHTSDWHLGRSLYGHNRQAEFSAFLDWLLSTLRQSQAHALLVAGDVFDTITPNHAAQELYYRFLAQVSLQTTCRHVLIIGGNHDSASFLNAPKHLLSALNVHVWGAATEQLEDEVLVLRDETGQAQAIVCAVPYLRDRDVRTSTPGESAADKNQALIAGIKQHYQHVHQLAEQQRDMLDSSLPLIATGHLFTQGGITLEHDGVRDLYVGNLAHVSADCFEGFDYVALGHLHVPQRVANLEHIRYSGSPLPMGFGEATQPKQVLEVVFTGRLPTVNGIAVPCFQALERIQGDWSAICERVQQLISAHSTACVEIVYQGNTIMTDLHEQLATLLAHSELKLLRVHNRQYQAQILSVSEAELALPDLTPEDVFEACLAQHDLDEEQKNGLRDSHQQVLWQLHNPEDESA